MKNKKFKIIDSHTHVFPDELAERAITHLETAGNVKAFYRGTIAQLIENMDKCGIDKSVALNIATKPKQVSVINKWASEMNKKYGDRVKVSGTLHPDFENTEQELDFLKKNKISFIKLHPEYQYIDMLSSTMDRIYGLLTEYDIAVYFHSGYDIAFEGVRCTPEILSKIIKKHPKLKIIAAHLGGWKLWNDTLKHLAGKNIYLDTAYLFGFIDNKQLKSVIDNHSDEHILFGTDAPWSDQKEYVEKILELGISENSLKKIFYSNSEKLFW